jgi:hypothetical protein
MRRSLVLSFALCSAPLLACGESGPEVYSPDDPAQFDLRMFDAKATAGMSAEDRGYVMGHAVGVYLIGKTLPTQVAYKGYRYRPGVSSPAALVAYDWEKVLVARSGGLDGSGGGVFYDIEFPDPPPENCDDDDDVETEGCQPSDPDGPSGDPSGPGGGGDPSDPGGDPTTPGGDPSNPGGDGNDPGGDGGSTPPGGGGSTPPGGGGSTPPSGDPEFPPGGGDPNDPNNPGGGDPNDPNDPGGGDPNDPGNPGTPEDPEIDDDCETFLDPAAVDARGLATRLAVEKMIPKDIPAADRQVFVAAFERGVKHALRVQDFGENAQFAEIEHLKPHVREYGLCDYSPIVLDLDGDGVRLSSVTEGVRFDLEESGRAVRTAWPVGGDALLVWDRDADGRIASGAELFGQSWSDLGGRWASGFAALAALDDPMRGGNANGRIDAGDLAFAELRVWVDADRDGATDPGELRTLDDAGIAALPLAHEQSRMHDAFGNGLRLVGAYERADGSTAAMVDVWFETRK